MRFGLYLLNHAPQAEDLPALFDDARTQTRTARERGFDLVTTGQHYLADYAYLQPVPFLSRLTEVSGSMTVGPGVLLLPLHQPVQIAEELSTLAAMAEDAVLGVGAGYRDVEFDSFSISKKDRAGRLHEGVEVIQRLWSEETVSYDGNFFDLEAVSLRSRPEREVPVWVAGHSKPAVERAARIGDGWFVGPHTTLDEAADLYESVYRPIRQKRGADTGVPIIRETVVAPTTEEAERIAREHLMPRYSRYVDWGQNDAMADSSELSQPFQELAADRFLVGTPAEVCAELERYRELLDVQHVIFRVQWPGLSHERAMESLHLLGDEVLPNV